MKNKLQFPGIKWILVPALLLFLSNSQTVNAQKKLNLRLNDVSILTTVSGNGFGIHSNPMLGIRINDKLIFSGGAVFKLNNSKFVGWSSHLTYQLLKPEHSISGRNSLYGFVSFERYYNQSFSQNWIATEELVSWYKVSAKNFESVTFNGHEAAIGFGTGRTFSNLFSLYFESGVSVYKVKQNNYSELKLYHQPKGFNLHLSLRAVFNLQ